MSTEIHRLKDSASDDIRELLRDAASVPAMSPTDREAILGAALDAAGAVEVGSTAAGAKGGLLSGKGLVLVVGAGVMVMGSALALRDREPAPAASSHIVATVSPPAVSSPVPTSEPSASATTPEIVLPRAATPAKPVTSERRQEDTLAAESALVGKARASLEANPEEALGLLKEHTRRFPRGDFAPERDFLMVKALRRLGRTDEARIAARAYATKHPSSPYVPAVRTILSELGGS